MNLKGLQVYVPGKNGFSIWAFSRDLCFNEHDILNALVENSELDPIEAEYAIVDEFDDFTDVPHVSFFDADYGKWVDFEEIPIK